MASQLFILMDKQKSLAYWWKFCQGAKPDGTSIQCRRSAWYWKVR